MPPPAAIAWRGAVGRFDAHRSRAAAICAATFAAGGAPAGAAAAPRDTVTAAAAPADTLTAAAAPADIAFRSPTTISGQLRDAAGAPLGGRLVLLGAARYPYRQLVPASHAITGPDGSFSFPALRPDVNTRYRVAEAGGGAVATPVAVTVEPVAIKQLYTLRFGRLMATVLTYHSTAVDWGRTTAYWFAAKLGARRMRLVATSRTREVRPGVTYATASFTPPEGPFRYRVCFNPDRQGAMGPPTQHLRCPQNDFVLRNA